MVTGAAHPNTYEIGNPNFSLCWNLDTRSGDHIAMDSCVGNLNEQWIITPLNDANHDSSITKVALGGSFFVNCCEPQNAIEDAEALRFLTAVSHDGTSSWYWVN